jgi:hypothetical protein
MILQKKIYKFCNAILVIINIIIVSIIVLAINKGFDFTDEGGFLLSYANVDIYTGGIYNYHIIINKLTHWLNPGIITYRILSLIITLFSSYILSKGIYKWILLNYKEQSLFKNFLLIFCFISIGNFLFYFTGVQTIHNNTLTNFIIQTATGLILYSFSIEDTKVIKSGTSFLILLVIGLLCAFSFFIKFSTGILQLLLYFIFLFFYLKKEKIKYKFIAGLILIIGFFFGLFIYFSLFQNYSQWFFNFKTEYKILSDHSPSLLINKYILDIINFFKFSSKYFSWLLLLPIFIRSDSIFSKIKKKNFLIKIIISLMIILFLYEVYYFKFYRSTFATPTWTNAYFFLIIISFLLILLFFLTYTKNTFFIKSYKANTNKVHIILFLLITPFLGAIGTANPIFLNVLIHSAPWFGVIIILIIEISKYIKYKAILFVFICIPGVVTTLQILDGNLFIPYYSFFNNLNKSNYFDQNEKVKDIYLLNGIYVDKKTKTFLTDLKLIFNKNNFTEKYPIFGFHIPGIVYLLQGISPGMPYYFNAERDYLAFDKFNLNNNPPVFLITDDNPIHSKLLNIINLKGIDFPNGYYLAGEVYFPNRSSNLKVYFPNNLLKR